MTTYDVTLTVQGKTVNEIASKMMTAAYMLDFELDDLEIVRRAGEPELLYEDAAEQLIRVTNPLDNDPAEEFRFPRTEELRQALIKRKKEE